MDELEAPVMALLDRVEIIDEQVHPTPNPRTPSIAPDTSERLQTDSPHPQRSAPTGERESSVPMARPSKTAASSLGWGLGTDGWPRHNSRVVRLFVGDAEALARAAAGHRWRSLWLGRKVRVDDELQMFCVPGRLWMPYPFAPLQVELRCQPFERRYVRVDVVIVSRLRWPRRFFDVASRCLTAMQILER